MKQTSFDEPSSMDYICTLCEEQGEICAACGQAATYCKCKSRQIVSCPNCVPVRARYHKFHIVAISLALLGAVLLLY